MPMPNQKTDPWKKERSRSGRKTRFFTLVELLVVISVLVILLSLLLPALKQSIEKGRSVSCIGNLRQVGAGVLQYTEEWNGYFTNRDSSARWANRGAYWSKISEKLGGPTNEELANLSAKPELIERIPKVFFCPSATYDRSATEDINSAIVRTEYIYPFVFSEQNGGTMRLLEPFIRIFPCSRIGNLPLPRRRSVRMVRPQITRRDWRQIPQTVCGTREIKSSTDICSRVISGEAIWSLRMDMSNPGKEKLFRLGRFSAGAVFGMRKESRFMIMR